MTDQQLERYAHLLLWCLDGVEGQAVRVRAEVVHRTFAVLFAEAAYRDGARVVDVDFAEPLLVRARIKHARDEYLAVLPDYRSVQHREYARGDWSNVSIVGSSEPDSLDGVDGRRVGRYYQAQRLVHRPLLDAMMRSLKPWVAALLPTRAIAQKAFPGMAPELAFTRYDRAVVSVLSLDSEDPVSIWQERFDRIEARRDQLDRLEIDSLRFVGPGTDLMVGLLPGSRWAAARKQVPDGRSVVVNIPSFEVYTTPDYRRTEGTVSITKPFESTSVPGRLVSRAWFEFREGAVVDYGADSGAEVIDEVLKIDSQARFLGEVALVDARSPIAQSGVVFNEVLFDENAASHIALGAGFPPIVEGCAQLADSQLLAAGVNSSIVHDDMMLGSSSIDVTATTRSGKVVEIMRQGQFVL